MSIGEHQSVSLRTHPQPHREVARRWLHYTKKEGFLSSLLFSVVGFGAVIIASFYAITYATDSASNSVSDIILSNIPAYDVDAFFAYGTIFLILFIVLLLLAHPKRLPYTLNCLSVFFIVRSFLTSLTHIGPFPTQIPPTGDWGALLSHFLFSKDLFFSGHTGVTFLLALVFWDQKGLRYIFLGWSVYMATVVLLGHYHYSIDVASAYFITFTINKICEWAFPAARALFLSDPIIEVS